MGGADDRVFSIKCPCCDSVIHVDPRRRGIYYTEEAGKEEKSFEDRVAKAKKKILPGAEEKFQKGLDAEKDRERKLDDLFKKAHEKALEDPNEKPPSIWDHE